MALYDDIKLIRQKLFLSQEEFAKELGVAHSTVNRWETNKSRPNLSAMRKIILFCASHNVSSENLENDWIEQ